MSAACVAKEPDTEETASATVSSVVPNNGSKTIRKPSRRNDLIIIFIFVHFNLIQIWALSSSSIDEKWHIKSLSY